MENVTIDTLIDVLRRVDATHGTCCPLKLIHSAEKLAEILLTTKNHGYNLPNIRRLIAAGFRITPEEQMVTGWTSGHIHTSKRTIVYG